MLALRWLLRLKSIGLPDSIGDVMTYHSFLKVTRVKLAFLFCTISCCAAVSPQYVFNRADFATGHFPYAVATADVNGDGRQDVIVANRGDNTVSVFLGKSSGMFATQKTYPTAMGPVAVVAADFNHDGKPDLAVATAAGVVSILLGTGKGTFLPHVDYQAGAGPFALSVGDFNHDGNLDLAVLNSSSNTVSILLGKGDGTFQPKVDYAVGSSPTAIVAQDLNGDGNLDLVVANSGESYVSILLGNANGTFKSASQVSTQSGPCAVAVADFNGDKIPDLAVSHQDAPWSLTILLGNGDGTFRAEQQVAQNEITYQMEAADVNGDGKADLILPIVFSGGAVVFLGKGDGSFQSPVVYTTGSYPGAVAVQDLNGDGNLDLAVVDENANRLTVLLGNGDGTFSPLRSLPPPPQQPFPLSALASAIGDFNGDGIPDVAVAEGNVGYSTGGVLVLLGTGNGSFEQPVYTDSKGAFGIAAADFNGDGHLDVAVANANGAAVLLGDGRGNFGGLQQVLFTQAQPARGLVVADFNNDGHQDLVVLGNGFVQQNPIYMFLGNGDGTFQPAKQFWSSNSIPMAIASGDFNHDGKEDLVVTLNPNGIAVMLGNGDGTFQAPVTYPTDQSPNGLTVADVNGDGVLDVIATGDLVDVFIGKGDGTFAKSVNYKGGSFPGPVITGDFNGDGKLDIVVAAEGPGALGDIEILLGNGTGKFSSPIEIASPAASSGPLQAGDLNQDGTSDLIAANGFMFLSTPIATISPTTLNFGTVKVGQTSAVKTVTIANNGNAPLLITALTAPAAYHIVNNCGTYLGARSSCVLKITFSPTAPGSDPGSLLLTDNAPRGHQSVLLAGQGK